MTEPAADQAKRERALDPARCFIVQAPAGSGKTELLVRRFLNLLELTAKPEEILAITFTRKAAAEMRKRVLEKIPDAAAMARRLRIETIDAFCLGLVRQTPVLAQLGARPQTLEDASDFYLESAYSTLQNFANPHVARLLAHLDNDLEASARLLAGMLARRDQWLRRTGNPPTRKEIEAALAFERERLLGQARALDPRASEAFASEVLTQKDQWRKNPEGQSLSGNEPLRKALAALRRMPPATYEPARWEALEAILALLPLAAGELKALFALRGVADFTEVLQGAVRALGAADDPSELLLSIDSRISHILVDEFQDTSYSQWQLLSLLTSGWQPNDGRTLFLVGDPMQSIYRFREAEVALFLRARRVGLGSVKLEPLTLTANFRSQENLVSFFNASFPTVFPEREDESSGAVPYSPSTATHPALAGEAACFHLFEETGDEAKRIIQLVKSATGTCAILVRNRRHLDAIVPALKAQGLRFRAIEIELLGDKQVVQDLYALTRALMHPADRIAWLAVLRAPWCCLLLSDLLLLTSEDGTLWELMNDDLVGCKLSEDGRKRMLRARDALWPAIRDRLRGTLRERVEATWLSLGGPACVESATDLEDAEIYLDELERLEEAGGIADPAALAAALEKLYALPDLEADERLQVMTIHKAKGLEFDTVIIPGLDRFPRPGEPPLFLWKELAGGANMPSFPRKRESRFLFAPIKEAGAEENLAYDHLARLEREAEDTEAGRLLYVAVTRARERVHLLGCVKLEDDGTPRAPDKRSLLAKLWPLDVPITRAAPAAAPASAPPPVPLRRLPAAYAPPAPPPPVAWQAPPEGREEEQVPFDWAREAVRVVGMVVHAWFQRIAEEGLDHWDAQRVEKLRAHFRRDLERRGVSPSEVKRGTEIVVGALKNALADERGCWILGPHPQARSELRISTSSGKRLRIDRYIEDSDGNRWVVDFKTSEHRGAGLEAYLDEQARRYARQLDEYAAAKKATRRGLYFPLQRGWRTW